MTSERGLWTSVRLLSFAVYLVVILTVGLWWGFPVLIVSIALWFVDLRPLDTLRARSIAWLIFWSSMLAAMGLTFWLWDQSWLGVFALALFVLPWALHPDRRRRRRMDQ
jgi:hypothetical protein